MGQLVVDWMGFLQVAISVFAYEMRVDDVCALCTHMHAHKQMQII